MVRTRRIQALWAIVATLVCIADTAALVAAERNVVLIVADDLGRNLGCYGSPDAKTLNLDALAKESTRFEYAFCTTASCSPSRSVLLTGLYNHANGQYGLAHGTHHFRSQAWICSLPVLLKEKGYRTCSIGKLHVEPPEIYPFDEFANEKTQGHRNSARMAENARSLIESKDAKPFFLLFCPTDPHRAQKGFANDAEYPGMTPIAFDPDKITVPEFLPDTDASRQDLAEYYQAIARLDQGVGKLLDLLKQSGHWNDTLVIFLSDNGPPFPGAKTTVYEPGTRLPLVIHAPSDAAGNAASGNVSQALVTWADITPTILAFADVAPPKYGLHGRSLLPILSQQTPQGWDEVYLSHTFHEVTMYYPMRVVRNRRYKLIMNLANELPFPFASDLFGSPTWQDVLARSLDTYGKRTVDRYVHRPRWELYDLQQDPHESNNLAEKPELASTRQELAERLRQWQEQTKDPWLIKYEHE